MNKLPSASSPRRSTGTQRAAAAENPGALLTPVLPSIAQPIALPASLPEVELLASHTNNSATAQPAVTCPTGQSETSAPVASQSGARQPTMRQHTDSRTAQSQPAVMQPAHAQPAGTNDAMSNLLLTGKPNWTAGFACAAAPAPPWLSTGSPGQDRTAQQTGLMAPTVSGLASKQSIDAATSSHGQTHASLKSAELPSQHTGTATHTLQQRLLSTCGIHKATEAEASGQSSSTAAPSFGAMALGVNPWSQLGQISCSTPNTLTDVASDLLPLNRPTSACPQFPADSQRATGIQPNTIARSPDASVLHEVVLSRSSYANSDLKTASAAQSYIPGITQQQHQLALPMLLFPTASAFAATQQPMSETDTLRSLLQLLPTATRMAVQSRLDQHRLHG